MAAEKMLAREDKFSQEMDHLIKAALPFYKKGFKSLMVGSLLRIAIMVVLLLAVRGIWLVEQISRRSHHTRCARHGRQATLA